MKTLINTRIFPKHSALHLQNEKKGKTLHNVKTCHGLNTATSHWSIGLDTTTLSQSANALRTSGKSL